MSFYFSKHLIIFTFTQPILINGSWKKNNKIKNSHSAFSNVLYCFWVILTKYLTELLQLTIKIFIEHTSELNRSQTLTEHKKHKRNKLWMKSIDVDFFALVHIFNFRYTNTKCYTYVELWYSENNFYILCGIRIRKMYHEMYVDIAWKRRSCYSCYEIWTGLWVVGGLGYGFLVYGNVCFIAML